MLAAVLPRCVRVQVDVESAREIAPVRSTNRPPRRSCIRERTSRTATAERAARCAQCRQRRAALRDLRPFASRHAEGLSRISRSKPYSSVRYRSLPPFAESFASYSALRAMLQSRHGIPDTLAGALSHRQQIGPCSLSTRSRRASLARSRASAMACSKLGLMVPSQLARREDRARPVLTDPVRLRDSPSREPARRSRTESPRAQGTPRSSSEVPPAPT